MFLNSKEITTLKSYVYSNPEEISAELKERKNNKALRKKVEDFFGQYFIKEFEGNPKAVLSRTVFTPNREFSYFFDTIHTFNLQPLLLEYDGKFVAKNPEKFHLCKLFFFDNIGKNGGINYETKRVVDFNVSEGKRFKYITTLWGEPIIDFHHRILEIRYPGIMKKVVDFSEWFEKTRYLDECYYFYFLSLFICHGVLFENFLVDDKEEAKFIKDHLFNSFEKVHRYFGVKPLIYPLLPLKNEKSRSWLSYKKEIQNLININEE